MAKKSVSKQTANPYFKIKVVDRETGRGVPLMRVHAMGPGTDHYTDSNGAVAFLEPGVMGRSTYFLVDGHGYACPKDEGGRRGLELVPEAGGEGIIEVERLLAAQRLYRITGEGIYHDTVLLGETAPTRQPVLNGGVCGSDSTQTAVYKGKLFWIWGDTKGTRSSRYWNFKVTGATSELPGNGGLDPEVGIDLDYFEEGDFTKKMAPLPGHYLYWLGSLHTVKDEKGKERLLSFYGKIEGADVVEKVTPAPARRKGDDTAHRAMGHGKFRVVGWGRAIFNDKKGVFECLEEHPIDPKSMGRFGSGPFVHVEDGVEYLCFTRGVPCVRVPHTMKALGDPTAAEIFTCLKEGCLKAEKAKDIDRDEAGRVRWGWKSETGAADVVEGQRMVEAGLIKDSERLCRFTDVSTGQMISARGSVYYNVYRKRWVAILLEVGGSSALGEVWYLEADTMLGPWVFAEKIVTHNNYSFYNILQHPYFAKRGGRDIFFEGTYTYTFTHPLNTHPTPRYDYNQLMYKLDLEDPDLFLPVPIYRYKDETGRVRYGDHASIPDSVRARERVFFAPDRPRAGTVAMYENRDRKTGATVLTRVDYDLLSNERNRVAFYGVAPEAGQFPPLTEPLYEYTSVETGERFYLIRPPKDIEKYYKSAEPVCLVWKSPIDFDPFGA